MPLTNSEIRFYDSNVLRLPADKRKEYHAQVDRLITELSRSIRNQTEIQITKVVKAGSFAKFTILRKTSTDPVDVDVVFYISGKNIDRDTLESLNNTIHALLLKVYPNKHVEDFEIQRKAATASSKTRLALDMDGNSISKMARRFRPARRVRSNLFKCAKTMMPTSARSCVSQKGGATFLSSALSSLSPSSSSWPICWTAMGPTER